MEETHEPRTRLKTIVVFAMLFAVFGAVIVFAYLSTFSQPLTTVILVRHAEKKLEPDNPDPDLTPEGVARSQEIARVFGDAGVNAIYATQYKRTQQTVKPLADKLALTVNRVDAKETAELVKQIRSRNPGQVVFIAGHNNSVPEIIAAMGGPHLPIIPETEYDNLYILNVYGDGAARLIKMKYGSAVMPVGNQGMMKP